jgi:hypothetical protein
MSIEAFIDIRTSKIQGMLYCRVLEDLLLFRSIGCNQVCYLYCPLSFRLHYYLGAKIPKATILYNESKHNILGFVNKADKC